MIEKEDLNSVKDAIVTHLDDTVLPIQKQVDAQQKSISKLYEKTQDNTVLITKVQERVKTVDVKHEGKHQEIKSSAKTAYIVIGASLMIITVGLTILAIAL